MNVQDRDYGCCGAFEQLRFRLQLIRRCLAIAAFPKLLSDCSIAKWDQSGIRVGSEGVG
jgi:hypothetical protein